jgi:hypothetical protein
MFFHAIPCDVRSQLHLTVQTNTTTATTPVAKLWVSPNSVFQRNWNDVVIRTQEIQ